MFEKWDEKEEASYTTYTYYVPGRSSHFLHVNVLVLYYVLVSSTGLEIWSKVQVASLKNERRAGGAGGLSQYWHSYASCPLAG